MKSLEQLFVNSISHSGENYYYKNSRHSLSFIPFEKSIYFILSEQNEKCLYGTITVKEQRLNFELDKKSSWLIAGASELNSINTMYDIFNYMLPVVNKKYKP